MATLTKAELRNRVLEHIGVVAAGESGSAEDGDLVDEAIDSAHAQLRKFGLAPYATSAVPEWAQPLLRDYVAGIVGPSFGLGEAHAPGKAMAEREMARQVSGFKHPVRVVADYY
jgi:hypothetical protein